MTLTDYYRFTRKACEKSKTRFECTASTGSYAPFEMCRCAKDVRPNSQRDEMRQGTLYAYINDVPKYFGGDVRRRADKSVTMKSRNVTSIFLSSDGLCGYGDVRGTRDAVMFLLHDVCTQDGVYTEGGTIEMFIAQGRAATRLNTFNALQEGRLNSQIEQLRRQAKAKSENTPL